jgi:hypothetical protein
MRHRDLPPKACEASSGARCLRDLPWLDSFQRSRARSMALCQSPDFHLPTRRLNDSNITGEEGGDTNNTAMSSGP